MTVAVSAFAVLACALMVVASPNEKADSSSAKARIGPPAPPFSLQDQNGKTVSLSDNSGKIVVLEWFNEDCPIDQRVYKQGIMKEQADKWMAKGVVWLAVNSTKDKTNETNKNAAQSMQIDWPILNDAPGDVGHAYGATNTPHMFIIDKDGKLAYMGAIDNDPRGNKSKGEVVNYVDKALTELTSGSSVSEPQTKAYGCNVKYAK
jgi:peroxiredoxin